MTAALTIHTRILLQISAAGATAILLAGCAVGPDYKRPSTTPAAEYAPTPLPGQTAAAAGIAGARQRLSVGSDISSDWWKLFDSPALNHLVEKAFAANPTIDAAVAALEQAQENVYAQRGYFFPTVQGSYSAQRTKLSGNTASANAPGIQGNGEDIVPLGPAEPVTYNFHTAELTVGFVPDVFGGNRRQLESLQAQADAARLQLEAAYVTLAANVVAAAIQEASTRAQIAAVNAIIAANTRSLSILRAQLELGYAARIDVAAQESALAQAQQHYLRWKNSSNRHETCCECWLETRRIMTFQKASSSRRCTCPKTSRSHCPPK